MYSEALITLRFKRIVDDVDRVVCFAMGKAEL